ncbi:MAG: hypothetical protein HOV87_19150 [Catenulispora sp.]|nr:hypothetical protein [Catenulispora sp.]
MARANTNEAVAIAPTTPATPMSTWTSGMPPGQNTLDSAIERVQPMLQKDYADWFSTFALQQPSGPNDKTEYALLVYRIPHPALDEAVRKALPDIKVVFVDAKISAKQHDALMNSVSFGYWKDRGLQINSLSCDFNGVCTFGVDDPDKWRAALEAEYGKAKVIVEKQGPATPGDAVNPAPTPK